MTQTAPGTRPDDAAPAKGEATGREFIALVTALMAMTALGIDLMLPAFPDIRSEFGLSADSTKVTWIITAYFLGMAIGPWLFGPASDRYGRRRWLAQHRHPCVVHRACPRGCRPHHRRTDVCSAGTTIRRPSAAGVLERRRRGALRESCERNPCWRVGTRYFA